jgi:bacillithiol biosynthesis cysteine-adding enzyme BshC
VVFVEADIVTFANGTPLIRQASVGGSRLVQDYLGEVPSALRFFAGSPHRLDTFRTKLAEVDAVFGPAERLAAAGVLRPTSDLARERLDRFVREGGVAVTTGQQTGFLTGPLYTIYKAISAAVLAEHLEKQLGRVVLPIFWSASEDHDWAEVDHAFVLDSRGRLCRFGLPSGDSRPLPMSRRMLTDERTGGRTGGATAESPGDSAEEVTGELRELADEIRHTMGGGPENEAVVRSILDAFTVPGRTVAEAFNAAMSVVLGRFGIVLADAADPALKALSRPALRRALEDAGAHEAALVERTREITDAGYGAQVAVLEGGTNVFREGERGRERLYRSAEGFSVRERRGAMEAETVFSELEANPQIYSPNVLLRPVIESCVLPTLAYVGGPGEIAYFAQVSALFGQFGRMPPVAVPRFAGLIVEPTVERSLEKLGFAVAELAESRDVLVEKLARRAMPDDATRTLAGIREEVVSRFDELAGIVEGIDPTLVGALAAERDRILLRTARAERGIGRAHKRSDRVALDRLDRVLDALRPNGQPQDRVLSVAPFLARYGERFLDEVREAIDRHWSLPTDG